MITFERTIGNCKIIASETDGEWMVKLNVPDQSERYSRRTPFFKDIEEVGISLYKLYMDQKNDL